MTDATPGDTPRIGRRRALRAAGAAALGITLSDAVVRPATAHADDGDPLVLGSADNRSTSDTVWVVEPPDGGVAPAVGLDMYVDDSMRGIVVSAAGIAFTSYGFIGGSFTGDDAGANLELVPRSVAGPPPGEHLSGEVVVDADGRLWLCDESTAEGVDASWEQVSHRGLRFLPVPVRVASRFDGQLRAGQTRIIDVRAKIPAIPPQATGIFANLTLRNPRNTGYVTVWEAGVRRPDVSNLVWTQTNGYLANFVMSRISPTGRVAIYVSQPTELYLDVAGYVL